MSLFRSGWAGSCAAFMFGLVLVFGPAAAAVDAAPRLEIQAEAGKNLLFVEIRGPQGESVRRLLRESASRLTPGKTGGDPRGRTLFATWSEAGSTARWSAFSWDAGNSWSLPRESHPDLMLRDGCVAPGSPLPVPAGLGLQAGNVFLVQLATLSLPEWRQALEEAGAEILGFFPHQAHLVRLDPANLAGLRALEFVERVEPFLPAYRLHPELRNWLAQAGPAEEKIRVRALAFAWGPAGKNRIAAAARGWGAGVDEVWPSGHILELSVNREQLSRLSGLDEVAWIDRWSAPETDMDILRQDAGTNWVEDNFGYCGTGVRGEVLDAGVEDSHMDFDGIILHGGHSSASHGTSTYGMVFGNGNRDGDGSAKGTGNIPCAQGIFADYDNLGDRFAHTQQLKQAPYFASFQSNSWGSSLTTLYNSYSQEMDDIIWRLDIAITQSQSNNGDRNSRPQAWAKNIISVGAINHYDTAAAADDCWCNGASIGPAEDGRIKPDVSYWYDDIYTTTTGNTYTSGFGGTSAATPATAGLIGIMLQMWADNVWGNNPQGSSVFEKQPHFSTIKALLINTAQQYSFSGTGQDLGREKQGWGRANVRRMKETAPNSFIIDQGIPLRLFDKASYDIEVLPGQTELKITLVYPDPPGTTSASLHRINDLDLVVTSPSGTVYNGNRGLSEGNWSTPGGSRNATDPVENVFVNNPQAGTWRVEIEAREINQDANLSTPDPDAVFSLVVTGGTGSICPAPEGDFTITPNPARVGQTVFFDSTVQGGSGGPYAYFWDFDGDGTVQANQADPEFLYRRPYSGKVQLKVKDGLGCPGKIEKEIVVNGPDVRYDSDFNLTEIEGNHNGAVDPGELFEISLRLKNQGNETASGVTAGLALAPQTAGAVSLLTGPASFGNLAPGATAAGSAPFRFRVGQQFPCGEDVLFSVVGITSLEPANLYPEQSAAVRVLVGGAGPPQLFYTDSFETNKGWNFQGNGEWQIQAPQGLGGGSIVPGQPKPYPDPTAAADGSKVLGNDLSGLGPNPGNYEWLINSTATSPMLDCSGAVRVRLEYKRWLNVAPSDTARLEVSADGTAWTTLFEDGDGLTEGAWSTHSFDVSDFFDRRPGARVRFGLESNQVIQLSGWNIDTLRLFGVTRESCEPVSRPKPGAAAGLTVRREASGSLRLEWTPDCGGAALYGLYRGDLTAGYSSLVSLPGWCGLSETSAVIPPGAGRADFYLVVPNDGAFEGGYGRTSAGVARPGSSSACFPEDLIDNCGL